MMHRQQRIVFLLLVFYMTVFHSTSASGKTAEKAFRTDREFCLDSTVNATCKENQVVLMTSAHFGRMRAPNRCISGEGYIGCSANVLSHLDKACSGQQSCLYDVIELNTAIKPCARDYTSYLEATWTCASVQRAVAHCAAQTQDVDMRAGGYILSAPDPVLNCAWRMRVGEGQHIRLVLYQFGNQQKSETLWNVQGECRYSLRVREDGKDSLVPLCNNNRREEVVYTSEKEELEVQIVDQRGQSQRSTRYMIGYQVHGCASITVRADMRSERRGESLIVRCADTHETWYLTCKGTQWIGEVGNCTANKNVYHGSTDTSGGKSQSFPQGVFLAIIIGVVMGVMIGTVMLFLVVNCTRSVKRRKKQAAMATTRAPPGAETELYPALLQPENEYSYNKTDNACVIHNKQSAPASPQKEECHAIPDYHHIHCSTLPRIYQNPPRPCQHRHPVFLEVIPHDNVTPERSRGHPSQDSAATVDVVANT